MKNQLSPSGMLRAGTGLVLLLALALLPRPGYSQMTEEVLAEIDAGPQPIKFSHRIHATDNLIPCQYCHIYARRSQVSGVPPVAICQGCHKLVASQLSEVKKVLQFWEDKKPIPWVKIHDLPDFVRYPHFKHVRARNKVYPNGIRCQECHGPVEKMDVVEKFDPDFGLMGWCLKCHLTLPGALERKRATPEAAGSARLMAGFRPDGRLRPNLTDCMTCHK